MPTSLTAATALRLPAQLGQLPDGDAYEFNFGGLNYVEPFGMLVCASSLRRFMREKAQAGGREIEFTVAGHRDAPGTRYAAHMGFFQSFGLEFGNVPGEARGSGTYLPLTKMNLGQLPAKGPAYAGMVAERRAQRLATVLLQQGSGPAFAFDAISYAITEMIRNVISHSRAGEVWYAAQYWHQRDQVQIAILDEGIGVRRSLERNPANAVTSDAEALRLALTPGVTGRPPLTEVEKFQGASQDPWENTGYGLYVTSRLCTAGGEFLIVSGNAALGKRKHGDWTASTAFKGTALSLVLRTTDREQVKEFIRRILPPGDTPQSRSTGS